MSGRTLLPFFFAQHDPLRLSLGRGAREIGPRWSQTSSFSFPSEVGEKHLGSTKHITGKKDSVCDKHSMMKGLSKGT